MTRTYWTLPALAAVLLGSAACETGTTPSVVPSGSAAFVEGVSTSAAAGTADALGADVNRQIAQLRRFLAPFHDLDKAIEYGYDTPAPAAGVCVSDPARGGMGYHYTMSSRDLIGDGEVSLFEPEFIVYSPTAQGGLRLSAVDYFVPYATWDSPEPPSLLGVPFHAEDGFQAWVLHIWAFWPNPAGMFENYNPDVPLCPA
jgi:hypothetical protein